MKKEYFLLGPSVDRKKHTWWLNKKDVGPTLLGTVLVKSLKDSTGLILMQTLYFNCILIFFLQDLEKLSFSARRHAPFIWFMLFFLRLFPFLSLSSPFLLLWFWGKINGCQKVLLKIRDRTFRGPKVHTKLMPNEKYSIAELFWHFFKLWIFQLQSDFSAKKSSPPLN